MSDLCYTRYTFKFDDEETAERFAALLDEATDFSKERNLKGQDIGSTWLGNILLECGYPYSYREEKMRATTRTRLHIGNGKQPGPMYYYRGQITDYDRKGDTVNVGTETANEPMPGVFGTALSHIGLVYDRSEGSFKGVTVRWYSDVNDFFGGSDSEYTEADIRVNSSFPKKLYDNDKKLQEIFSSDDEEYDDDSEDGDITINQFDYKDRLIKQLQEYLGDDSGSLDDLFRKLRDKLSGPEICLTVDDYYKGTDTTVSECLPWLIEGLEKDERPYGDFYTGLIDRNALLEKMQKHLGDIKTIDQGIAAISKRYSQIHIYNTSYDVWVTYTDFEFYDWLKDADFNPDTDTLEKEAA